MYLSQKEDGIKPCGFHSSTYPLQQDPPGIKLGNLLAAMCVQAVHAAQHGRLRLSHHVAVTSLCIWFSALVKTMAPPLLL
mmetsp:Transcript_14677/g.37696  ORF Transcript_14677/g.37696 Transcript_14677/m.37696 type:complete len:80 (+) Transcript_14677:184-423(+)